MPTNWGEGLGWLFGGDVPDFPLQAHQVAARTVLLYIIGLLVVRIGKSRMLGRVTAIDMILGIILGSLLSRGITGDASLSGTAVAVMTIVILHWWFTWIAVRSQAFGRLMKGHVVTLVRDGQIDQQALERSHISRNDLESELRQHGVTEIRDVALACKERNGQISVVPRQSSSPADPIM